MSKSTSDFGLNEMAALLGGGDGLATSATAAAKPLFQNKRSSSQQPKDPVDVSNLTPAETAALLRQQQEKTVSTKQQLRHRAQKSRPQQRHEVVQELLQQQQQAELEIKQQKEQHSSSEEEEEEDDGFIVQKRQTKRVRQEPQIVVQKRREKEPSLGRRRRHGSLSSSSESEDSDRPTRRRHRRRASSSSSSSTGGSRRGRDDKNGSSSSDDSSVDDRRQRLLAKRRRQQQEQQNKSQLVDKEGALEKEQPPPPQLAAPREKETLPKKPSSSSSSSGSGSEETSSSSGSEESSSSEEDEPQLTKPLFVPKHKRQITAKAQEEELEAKRLEEKANEYEQKRIMESRALVAKVTAEAATVAVVEEQEEGGGATNPIPNDEDPTDIKLQEEERDAWEVRELQRLLQELDKQEQIKLEQAEIQRRRNMTDEEHMRERQRQGLLDRSKDRGQEKESHYSQRYHHRGAFYMDKDELDETDVRHRAAEYSRAATASDKIDKKALPKVMQVKKFGFANQSRYQGLAKEDTTDRQAEMLPIVKKKARKR